MAERGVSASGESQEIHITPLGDEGHCMQGKGCVCKPESTTLFSYRIILHRRVNHE